MKYEISLLRVTAPMNLFCLDCVDVNDDLGKMAQSYRDKLSNFCDRRKQGNQSQVKDMITSSRS